VASNLVFFIIKLAAGLVTGSIAVLSDALDSGEDLIASGVALFSVRLALHPADLEHPYGHGKVESLGTMFEAGVIAAGAGFVTFYALSNITDEDRDIETTLGLIVMGAAFITNFFVGRYVFKVARETDSMILMADARHIMTNMAQAAAVATALMLVAITGNAIFDPIVALLLAAFLFYTAAQLLWQAINEIMDVSLPHGELELIEQAVRDGGPDVRGFHRLRARRSGPMRLIDMHLIMAPDATVTESHSVTEDIERRVKDHYPRSSLVIHVEPDDGRFRGPRDERAENRHAGRAGSISEPLPQAADEPHGHHH
jgi:cation diffusion facilitator family transporter